MLPSSTIGRKIMMAITGQFLVIFIIFHIAGNSSIFFHALNAYVVALHTLPVVVWGGRLFIIAAFTLHIWYGTVLKLENYAAKPQTYAMTNFRNATFAGRNQIWTGVVIAAFLIYHLLQFTFRMTDPSISADTHQDALGRADVFMMVVRSFQQIGISGSIWCFPGGPGTAPPPRHPKLVPDLGNGERQNASGHRNVRQGCIDNFFPLVYLDPGSGYCGHIKRLGNFNHGGTKWSRADEFFLCDSACARVYEPAPAFMSA